MTNENEFLRKFYGETFEFNTNSSENVTIFYDKEIEDLKMKVVSQLNGKKREIFEISELLFKILLKKQVRLNDSTIENFEKLDENTQNVENQENEENEDSMVLIRKFHKRMKYLALFNYEKLNLEKIEIYLKKFPSKINLAGNNDISEEKSFVKIEKLQLNSYQQQTTLKSIDNDDAFTIVQSEINKRKEKINYLDQKFKLTILYKKLINVIHLELTQLLIQLYMIQYPHLYIP